MVKQWVTEPLATDYGVRRKSKTHAAEHLQEEIQEEIERGRVAEIGHVCGVGDGDIDEESLHAQGVGVAAQQVSDLLGDLLEHLAAQRVEQLHHLRSFLLLRMRASRLDHRQEGVKELLGMRQTRTAEPE